jgi:hypothetical protein
LGISWNYGIAKSGGRRRLSGAFHVLLFCLCHPERSRGICGLPAVAGRRAPSLEIGNSLAPEFIMPSTTIRTEIRGLDLTLDEISLSISSTGQDLVAPITLSPEEVERLRLEMAKRLLPEWNQLEEMKAQATMRYRRYLGAWLVMCAAAFSAYVSYPEYFLCVFLLLLSIFLWWRAAYMERQSEREAQAIRSAFRPDWSYLQERLQESDERDPGQ